MRAMGMNVEGGRVELRESRAMSRGLSGRNISLLSVAAAHVKRLEQLLIVADITKMGVLHIRMNRSACQLAAMLEPAFQIGGIPDLAHMFLLGSCSEESHASEKVPHQSSFGVMSLGCDELRST